MKYIIKLLYLLLFSFIFTASVPANCIDTSFVIGEYKVVKVIDGDTFRFEGLDKSTRLLCIDTEETYKGDNAYQKTNDITKRWIEIYNSEKKKSIMPVKIDSPFGFYTWQWAKEFFKDVEYVRLEKDDNIRNIDIYGRYLVYIILIKNGKEINYNIECVRQGMSPYYSKYGYSRRFHREFLEAQSYAIQNKLGIWDSSSLCYPDYKERVEWWTTRAEQILKFETTYSGNPNYFNLLNEGEYKRLENYLGEEIVIFGSISEILTNKLPYLLKFTVTQALSFDVVLFEDYIYLINELNLEEKKEYYTYIRGKLEIFKGNYQIILKSSEQVWM